VSKRLEIEVDYELSAEDVEKLREYIAQGMTPGSATLQLAQDVLGHTGAQVQGAEYFDN